MPKTANTILTLAILAGMAILLLYGYFAMQKLDEKKEVKVTSNISKHINYKQETTDDMVSEESEDEVNGLSEDDNFEEYIEEAAEEEEAIVEPVETTETPVPAPPAVKVDAAYLVISGSFKNLSNAEAKVQELKKMGIDAEIVRLKNSSYHSICIAKSGTETEANDTMAALVTKHNIKAFVYKVP